MPPKKTTTPMIEAAIKQLITQGVADALAEYEETRNSGNGDDSHDSRSGRRTERATRWCTYSDFLKCQPLNFKVKFATCTLLGNALTWWNSHVKTVSHETAYGMTWKTLKKMMTDKYCPRGEIKKLEIELWNLKVKGTNVNVGGLPDMIQGSVMASKPKTMQDAIKIANDLMDQKICTIAERQAENKRKLDNNNQAQQQHPKKQNVARAYYAKSSEKKEYAGTLPLCNKWKFHHNGPCTIKCVNCKMNQNHENQAGGTKARGMVYALGGGETDQDLNNMEDDINA
ncbi:reverse transcriptase domain-containing protein [Tanacetum coccineum]